LDNKGKKERGILPVIMIGVRSLPFFTLSMIVTVIMVDFVGWEGGNPNKSKKNNVYEEAV